MGQNRVNYLLRKMGIDGMKVKACYLPEQVGFHSAKNTNSLAIDLSQNICEILKEAIMKRGRGSMAVSGGKTPVPLFEKLSQLNLDWKKVIFINFSPLLQ